MNASNPAAGLQRATDSHRDADEVMPDLDSRSEIHNLVIRFYRDVATDDLLGPVFGEVAEVDWSVHIPRLIDYWCRVLLGQPGYDGYILGAHQHVHQLEAFRGELFDRWYVLFVESVDDGWQGPVADKAKAHAARIAGMLARRLIRLEWEAPSFPLAATRVTGSPRSSEPARHQALPGTAWPAEPGAQHDGDEGGDPACWAHLFEEKD